MEENSQANNSVNNNITEEVEGDDNSVALILVDMKSRNLKDEEHIALDRMKKHVKVIGKIVADQNQTQEEEEEDNTDVAINLPPVEKLIGLIGNCSEPLEKKLTSSNASDNQNRLTLNREFVKRFIKPLLKSSEDLSCGIAVTAHDKEGNEYPMTFKIWTGKYHVLIGKGWKKFRLDHRLQSDACVTVWMFRHNQTDNLCFAILPKPSSSIHQPISFDKVPTQQQRKRIKTNKTQK